ncbi:glycosyltransferase family 2 protein [Fundidesulfovibrio soli]|uniref:glycosyltransferase family 2 protein n=1 Tax=Fundidesulfovibrio soli TaxID=2922716 RepID=UPI001FAFD938
MVVPAYNQGRYLAACLDSLWFQDHPDLEIIVVEDGSTDDTPWVLAEYRRALEQDEASYASRYIPETDTLERAHHPRYPKAGRSLRVIEHGRNRGLAAALNTGMAAATGQAVSYVPADDWCMANMFSELARALDEAPARARADFAYADMLIVDDAFRVTRRFDLPDYSFERSFADWYLCGNCKLYRRELHERFGYYDEALLAHDHDLFQRFALGGAKFVHVPKALMAVRDHAQRQVDIHAPSNWSRLIGESKRLALEARRHMAGTK